LVKIFDYTLDPSAEFFGDVRLDHQKFLPKRLSGWWDSTKNRHNSDEPNINI